jgi:hypothetical protein
MKTRRMNQNRFALHLRIATAVALAAGSVVCALFALPLSSTGSSTSGSQWGRPLTTIVGGATVLRTTQTVQHWFGSTLDPQNGVTYGYNIVGADPNNCSGPDCDVTITVDIIPLNAIVAGESFNGTEVVAATLASPVFALNDYGSTPFATAPGAFPNDPSLIQGPGGVLSQNDAGNQLQLQDAIQRAEFNKTGLSSYHLRLNPVVHDPITFVVPSGKSGILQSPNGLDGALIDYDWWSAQIQTLNGNLAYLDPTHLVLYLTKDLLLIYRGDCCTGGFHGTVQSKHGNGNQPVQTFAWATYGLPGGGDRPNGGTDWASQDITVVSHEISEWANDPFGNNSVEPWATFTAPQYGCVGNLETGDPVVAIGFAMGTNIYFQGPNPDGSQSADGYYHPQDEVFLPWFMRLAPNNISEPTQSPSTNIGRYSFMGDLNQFPGFRQPATGCP